MTPDEIKPFFLKEIARVINQCSLENISDTPDFILAESLWYHLISISEIINKRNDWYKRK